MPCDNDGDGHGAPEEHAGQRATGMTRLRQSLLSAHQSSVVSYNGNRSDADPQLHWSAVSSGCFAAHTTTTYCPHGTSKVLIHGTFRTGANI